MRPVLAGISQRILQRIPSEQGIAAANGLSLINRISILSQMGANKNITMPTNTKYKCIDSSHLVCEDKDGKEVKLPFNLAVSASGTNAMLFIVYSPSISEP